VTWDNENGRPLPLPERWKGTMAEKRLTGLAKAARLRTIADKANALHEEATTAWRGALTYARECGELLNEAKRLLGGRGKWGRWVDRNFDGRRRTARVYMRIARYWDDPRLKEALWNGMEIKSIQAFLKFVRRDPLLSSSKKRAHDEREYLRKWFGDALKELKDEEVGIFAGAIEYLWDKLYAQLKHTVCAVLECDYYEEKTDADKSEIRRRALRTTNKPQTKRRAVAKQPSSD
jgi:hypothetical protein